MVHLFWLCPTVIRKGNCEIFLLKVKIRLSEMYYFNDHVRGGAVVNSSSPLQKLLVINLNAKGVS